jgi:hypothetical protein
MRQPGKSARQRDERDNDEADDRAAEMSQVDRVIVGGAPIIRRGGGWVTARRWAPPAPRRNGVR